MTDDEEPLHEMLSHLSEEELEIAAQTSHSYFQNPDPDEREKHALDMARRYYKSKKSVPVALEGMKATIQYRKENNIDQWRRAFDNDDDNNEADSAELAKRLESGKNVVMGYDKEGRSTFHFRPPKGTHHDLEWTLKESIYTMERAIACTKADTVNAVIDFEGFEFFQHAPPLQVGKEFLTTLRHHYVGYFYKIFLVNTPKTFESLWNIFENFVGTSTRQKITMVPADRKEEVVGEYYTPEEAAPWMMPGGKKDRELDVQEYLYKTPFDKAFDE